MLFAFRHLPPPQTKNGKISQVTDRERDLTFSNWKPYAYDHFFAFLFSNGSKGKLKWYILVDASKVDTRFSFQLFHFSPAPSCLSLFFFAFFLLFSCRL
jgi:hypothetical protein